MKISGSNTIRVGINPPRIGKDYNEMLLHVTKKMKDHQQQCRQKQAAISIDRRILEMMNTENTALQMIAEAARCPDYGPRHG